MWKVAPEEKRVIFGLFGMLSTKAREHSQNELPWHGTQWNGKAQYGTLRFQKCLNVALGFKI